jgi:hypothetical protein
MFGGGVWRLERGIRLRQSLLALSSCPTPRRITICSLDIVNTVPFGHHIPVKLERSYFV